MTTTVPVGFYDDIMASLGDLDDQRDQVAAILSSKTLEPKTMILAAFRCAMTVRPHTQSAITEAQFNDFAYFAGYADGLAVCPKPVYLPIPNVLLPTAPFASDGPATNPSSTLAEVEGRPKQKIFRRLGRQELQEIFSVCVRSQGVMNEHSFALAVAHLQASRSLAMPAPFLGMSVMANSPSVSMSASLKAPNNATAGGAGGGGGSSKSLRLLLSEAAEMLTAYVRPRTQTFPFPIEYFDSCSSPLRCLWKYSEGLENIFRHYVANNTAKGEKDVLDWRGIETCLVEVGIIPQLSQQAAERLLQQCLAHQRVDETTRSERQDDAAEVQPTERGRRRVAASGLTMESFLEFIARIAAALYADDVFSKRITLESKIEHLITTVLGAAYFNLFGVPLPSESEDIPLPIINRIEPAEVSEAVTSVRIYGDYFGAIGRGVWFASTLSSRIVHVPQSSVMEDHVVIPLTVNISRIPWDECIVVAPNATIFNFIFRHHVRICVASSPEDVLHRADVCDGAVTVVGALQTVHLSSSTSERITRVFEDGCAQLAFNKTSLYDFCWEYVCSRYAIGSMVSLEVPAALGFATHGGSSSSGSGSPRVSGDRSTSTTFSPITPGNVLMMMFSAYAREKDNGGSSGPTEPSDGPTKPRPLALTLQSFTEVLCRLAMASGCTAEAVDDAIKAMLVDEQQAAQDANHPTYVGATGATGSTGGGQPVPGNPRRGSRRSTFLSNERRFSEFGGVDELDIGGGFAAGRRKSLRDNESILRTVATEQRVVKVLRQSNNDLKAKLDEAVAQRNSWKATKVGLQTTISQLSGLLEIVLPTSMEAAQVNTKLAIAYRKQLLDMCHGMVANLRTAGDEEVPIDVDFIKNLVQQQLDILKGAAATSTPGGAGHGHHGTGKPRRPLVIPTRQAPTTSTSPVASADRVLEAPPAESGSADEGASRKVSDAGQDLENMVAKLRLEKDSVEREIGIIRSALAQQRHHHEKDLAALQTTVQEKVQALKTTESEKRRLETSLAQLETVSAQRRIEIVNMQSLIKQQENAIQGLTNQLADMVTQVQDASAAAAASAAGDDGNDDAGAASTTSGKKLRRRSSSVSASSRRRVSSKYVSPQAQLMKELEAVRASEREFLRGQIEAANVELEKELAAHDTTRLKLEDMKQKMTAMAAQMRRMYQTIREVDQLTAEQLVSHSKHHGHDDDSREGATHSPTTPASEGTTVVKKVTSTGPSSRNVDPVSGSVSPRQIASRDSSRPGSSSGAPPRPPSSDGANATIPQRPTPVHSATSTRAHHTAAPFVRVPSIGTPAATVRSTPVQEGPGTSIEFDSNYPMDSDGRSSTVSSTAPEDQRATAATMHRTRWNVLQTIKAKLTAVDMDGLDVANFNLGQDSDDSFSAAADVQRQTPIGSEDWPQIGVEPSAEGEGEPRKTGESSRAPSGAPSGLSKWRQTALKVVHTERDGDPSSANSVTAGKSPRKPPTAKPSQQGSGIAQQQSSGNFLSPAQPAPGSPAGKKSVQGLHPSWTSPNQVRTQQDTSRRSVSSASQPPLAATPQSPKSSAPPPGAKGNAQRILIEAAQRLQHGSRRVVDVCNNCSNTKRLLKTHHELTKRFLDVMREEFDRLRRRVATELRDGHAAIRDRGDLILRAVYFAPHVIAAAKATGGHHAQTTIEGGTIPTANTRAARIEAALAAITSRATPALPQQSAVLSEGDMSPAALGAPSQGTAVQVSESATSDSPAPWQSRRQIMSQIPDDSPLHVIKGETVALPHLKPKAPHWVQRDADDVDWEGQQDEAFCMAPSPFKSYSRRLQQQNVPLDPNGIALQVVPLGQSSKNNPNGGLPDGRTVAAASGWNGGTLAHHHTNPPHVPSLEGAICYKVLHRDKTTGEITVVDRPAPPAPNEQPPNGAANAFPKRNLPHRRTATGPECLPHLTQVQRDALVAAPQADFELDADAEDALVDASSNPPLLLQMVKQLLIESSRRWMVRSAHPNARPLSTDAVALRGESPRRVTTTGSAEASASRLGPQIASSSWSKDLQQKIKLPPPTVRIDRSKLEKVRSHAAKGADGGGED